MCRFCQSSIVALNGFLPPSNSSAQRVEAKSAASWTVLVYMEADNNLSEYSQYFLNTISAGLASNNGINVLVQIDKPKDNTTWRYKIIPGSNVNAGNLPSEMGYDPSTELYNAMKWVVVSYPAKHYALILMNHGTGILDFSPDFLPKKGILYDDSQQTCLTNQGLTSALAKIKKMLGKKIDLLAMDACLMAMVEVAYQTKDCADLFIASEQISHGFPYVPILHALSRNPTGTSPLQLAQIIVSANHAFYTQVRPISDFTISAIDITSIDLVKKNIDKFITAIAACSKIDVVKTKEIILAARKASISFQMADYIDLHSFYSNVVHQVQKAKVPQGYKRALNALAAVINDGLAKITKVVLHNATGPVFSAAKGISIYYPSSGKIHPSYQQTLFAHNTAWVQFVETYHE